MSTEQATESPALRVPAWSDALTLNLPTLDETHREFVELLARAVEAPDAELLAAWDAVISHTREHFEMENQGMQATGFPPGSCHTREHSDILAVMQEGARRGALGEHGLLRQLASELGTWFEQHAQSMDNAFALYANWVGYDFASGAIAHPERIPPAPEPTAC
ncbi:MAG: hemerythrin [Betaproteobacteria bacterium]|jgi:hemerythrin-like metal-binding protein|nr:hemerythrin [Betaproteobacteria bacterium]NBS45791.1 hemerythrin [Betaproteobacteria bacterium]